MEGIMCFSVPSKLRQMGVGESIVFCAANNEMTIRNACTRLKSKGVGEWKVKKMASHPGYEVTRTA